MNEFIKAVAFVLEYKCRVGAGQDRIDAGKAAFACAEEYVDAWEFAKRRARVERSPASERLAIESSEPRRAGPKWSASRGQAQLALDVWTSLHELGKSCDPREAMRLSITAAVAAEFDALNDLLGK